MTYLLDVLVLCCIYSVLASSLDLIAGHAGIPSLAHAGFYGIGAYASALLSVRLGAPFGIGLLAGMLISVLLSLLISIPSLRLRGDYFIIVTFGFQVIVFNALNNLDSLTGGPLGVGGVARPVIPLIPLSPAAQFALLAALVAVLGNVVVWHLGRSSFGRVLHALREDEVLAASFGKNTLRAKVGAFAISAGIAASAGSLYAHFVTYVDPTIFTTQESILVLSMVIIGGLASRWGPVLGAVLLVALPEALRLAGVSGALAANFRQILYGTALVLVLLYRPQGIVGQFRLR